MTFDYWWAALTINRPPMKNADVCRSVAESAWDNRKSEYSRLLTEIDKLTNFEVGNGSDKARRLLAIAKLIESQRDSDSRPVG